MSSSPVKSNESVTLAYASKSLQPPHPLDLNRETRLLFSDNWTSETDSSNLFYSSGIVPDSDGFANPSENINHSLEEEEEEEEINDDNDSEYDEEDTFRVDEEPGSNKNNSDTNPCNVPINDSQLASILESDIEKHSSRFHHKRSRQDDDGTRLQKRAKTSYNRFSSEADNAVFQMSLPPSSPIYQPFSDNEEYDPTYLPKNETVTTNNSDRMVTRSSVFLQHETTAADSHNEISAVESVAAPSNSSYPLRAPLPDPQSRVHNNLFCYLSSEIGFEMAQKRLTSAIDEGNPHLQLSNLSLQKLPPEISDIKDLVSLNREIVVDLSQNLLTDLDYDLFKITNMSELNLCRNNITVIPPAIHNLTNLTVLKLDGNKFSFLPAEIFSLPKLKTLTATCLTNMLVPSKHQAAAASSKHRIQKKGTATNMLSAPAFKNMFRYWAEITSTSIPDEQLKVLLRISKAREYPVRDPSLQTEPDSKLAVGSANVTSLLSLVKGVTLKETILQLLADTGITQEHAAHLGEYFKDPIPELLQEAQQVHQSCGVCGRAPLVMPVASVLEWWFESLIKQEIVFKRSFCSTRCFVAWATEIVKSVPDLF